ncbi:MAG: hypothetical protein IPH20_05235 [Bacteroidales bacterium]|nr:hypothetical protein [Bacteroidales bacterium]
MRKLSLIIGTLVLLTSLKLMTPNPHGKELKISCVDCHVTDSWKVNPDSISFSHENTAMPLVGAHRQTNCRSCHESLVFTDADPACNACHTDIHEQTVGPDCERCHTPESWIINNIVRLHEQTRFPLMGAHASAECSDCHLSESLVKFEPLSVECYSCHQDDYNATTQPNHVAAGYSTGCDECHFVGGYSWKEFSAHDAEFFPIYSGQHNGVWNDCSDCHTNPSNYGEFSCTNCHEHNQGDMDDEHGGVSGYSYNSLACYGCHPTGSGAGSFNHNNTGFPLTGAHTNTDCQECHTNGNTAISTVCSECHQDDYNASTNPNHGSVPMPNTCETCHTTAPGWKPATFPNHNEVYALNGAHANISNDCASCHTENYNNTPNTCIGCHQNEYDQANEPPHAASQFSTECLTCHTETAWKPATFDHDGQYFPIYSGKHNGQWEACSDCHTNASNYAQFSCIDCHEHNQADTDNEHNGIGGYAYNSPACFACHPTGDASAGFNHNTTAFPLTGAHTTTDCLACHTNGYTGTTTVCGDCHVTDYNQATNPNHVSAGIPNTCATCHTTEPGWQPATFPIHNEIYPLNGAHAVISNNCSDCHNGNYNTTPNTCVGCHLDNYNQTNDPPHASAQFPTECLTCHTENAWTPSTFNHDGQYFPIYSGKHNGEWTACSDCHTNASNYAQFSCIDCHEHNQADTDNEHNGIGGYAYNSPACFACHPTGDASAGFNHNTTAFPLTGAHTTTNCESCHSNGYAGTTTVCGDCHVSDYNQAVNPNHTALGIPNTCATCHTTNPGWQPATFPTHNQYYPLNGAHATISNNCVDCHNGNYNTTPNTCVGCHLDNYNQTNDPPHASAQFPTSCQECHTENAWTPSTFNHDGQYFPIYSGQHNGEWAACSDCHTNSSNYAVFSCIDCHEHNQADMNDEHNDVSGYQYNSNACFQCHPDGDASSAFNHNSTDFPLTGSHATLDCISCHSNGYAGTTTVCSECHITSYNQTTNPNHAASNIPNTCETCHSTDPGWQPATFPIHENVYPLTGGHAVISNNCTVCHNGNYNTTPNTCNGCHTNAYNQTTNPNHATLGIPTDCATCHTTNPGWNPATFPIHSNYYPLTGGHAVVSNDCAGCHNGNYNNTPSECAGCHQDNYNQTANPGHVSLNLSTVCATCHTTNPGWNPALFPDHNNYYVLEGAHTSISNCDDCHNNNYNTAPNTCVGCHLNNYNQTNDPPHASAQYPTECETCHTQTTWTPSTFDHDNQYFPIYSGEHNGEWNTCSDCHTNPGDYGVFSCFQCHSQNDMNQEHQGVSGYTYNSDACLSCHPDGSGSSGFNHSTTSFPLTGAHNSVECSLCHTNGYAGTTSVCSDCHISAYNQTTNPNHTAIGIPNTCATCHSTEPGWQPAGFPIHSNYYPLTGGHAVVASNCAGCHNGNYNTTPNTCSGCHINNFNQTSNPSHTTLNLSTECLTCHTTNPGWEPALFPNHNSYYVIQGAHTGISDCDQCHNGNYNSAPTTCAGCHMPDYNQTNDPPHASAQYPTDCEQCHTQTAWNPSTFDHDNQYFPIYSGQHNNEWNTCSDCHTNSSNYAVFSCFQCHSQSEMNQEHQGISGYSYNSDACLNCHPDGDSKKGLNRQEYRQN